MRIQGWEKALEQYIQEQKNSHFVWGANDCVLFSARAANAIVEHSLDDQINSYGNYNEESAIDLIRRHGGISGIIDKHFKRYAKPLMAKRGDIVLVKIDGHKACGIIDNTGRNAICKTMDGIRSISINKALLAWEVQ